MNIERSAETTEERFNELVSKLYVGHRDSFLSLNLGETNASQGYPKMQIHEVDGAIYFSAVDSSIYGDLEREPSVDEILVFVKVVKVAAPESKMFPILIEESTKLLTGKKDELNQQLHTVTNAPETVTKISQ